MLQRFWEAFSHLVPTFSYGPASSQNSLKSRFFLKEPNVVCVASQEHNARVRKYPHKFSVKSKDWAQVLIPPDHPPDVSAASLDSICGKFSWLDMIWERLTPVYIRSHVDGACQSTSQAWSQRNRLANLPDRFVWRRRSGGGVQKHFCCFKGFSECSTLPRP